MVAHEEADTHTYVCPCTEHIQVAKDKLVLYVDNYQSKVAFPGLHGEKASWCE